MTHSVRKGDITEYEVIAALLKAGRIVLKPVSNHSRYDLVVDDDGKFFRIQCKTGRLRLDGTTIIFNTASYNPYTKERRGYQGQVDFFGVYCIDTDAVYLVPVEHTQGGECYLRVKPTHKRNGRMYKYAKEYRVWGKG